MLMTQRLLGTPNGLSLVGPGFLSSPLNLTRAQLTGVQSSAINGTNDGLTLYGADVPRFTGSAQRLLIEGQGTNGFSNPRLEGAAAGNPGTAPTYTNTSFFSGLSREIVGTGTEDNIPYIDLRFFGTATGGSFSRFGLTNITTQGLNISGNAVNTFSVFVRLVGGSLSQINSCRIGIQGRNSAGSVVSGQSGLLTFTPTGAALRLGFNAVTWVPSDLTIVYGEWFLDIVRGGTATVDVTLRIGLPDHKLGAFASSPILPPVGTPGASTRGTDLVTASLSNLGLGSFLQIVAQTIVTGGSSSVLIVPRPISTLTGIRAFINGVRTLNFNLEDDPFNPGLSTWVVFSSLYGPGTLFEASVPTLACTVLWSGVIPSFVPGGVHTIACFDDGSISNRYTMRVDQASGQLQSMRALGGSSSIANAGTVVAGTPFKGGMTIDGLLGTAGVSLNGNAVAEVTGGPLSGLTQFRLGNIFDASTPMWGETSYFRLIPNKVSYAELQSLTGALP